MRRGVKSLVSGSVESKFSPYLVDTMLATSFMDADKRQETSG